MDQLEELGLFFTGRDGNRMEVIELDRSVHPFYFACQYHPEFKTRPHNPSPPFLGLILAAAGGGRLEEALPFARDTLRGVDDDLPAPRPVKSPIADLMQAYAEKAHIGGKGGAGAAPDNDNASAGAFAAAQKRAGAGDAGASGGTRSPNQPVTPNKK